MRDCQREMQHKTVTKEGVRERAEERGKRELVNERQREREICNTSN